MCIRDSPRGSECARCRSAACAYTSAYAARRPNAPAASACRRFFSRNADAHASFVDHGPAKESVNEAAQHHRPQSDVKDEKKEQGGQRLKGDPRRRHFPQGANSPPKPDNEAHPNNGRLLRVEQRPAYRALFAHGFPSLRASAHILPHSPMPLQPRAFFAPQRYKRPKICRR